MLAGKPPSFLCDLLCSDSCCIRQARSQARSAPTPFFLFDLVNPEIAIEKRRNLPRCAPLILFWALGNRLGRTLRRFCRHSAHCVSVWFVCCQNKDYYVVDPSPRKLAKNEAAKTKNNLEAGRLMWTLTR